jgi:hypothetical protein
MLQHKAQQEILLMHKAQHSKKHSFCATTKMHLPGMMRQENPYQVTSFVDLGGSFRCKQQEHKHRDGQEQSIQAQFSATHPTCVT